MKKRFHIITLLSLLIVCGLLNLILFLTIPDARLSEGGFWMAWAFAFPFFLTVAILSTWLVGGKANRMLGKHASVYWVNGLAFIAYTVLGFILMYYPFVDFTFPIILEAILTAAYIILLLYLHLSLAHLAGNRAEVKSKVLFIRLLQSDLESCFFAVDDPALLAELRRLSEKIRYSDPMSHPSLSAVESDLSVLINAIASDVKSNTLDSVPQNVKRASGLLDLRNDRCRILK